MATPGPVQPQSVRELVRQNPTKRGLAVIVTNDYSTTGTTLEGPQKDGARMRTVFQQLKIATYCKHNVGCSELMQIMNEVSRLGPCPQTYESISFVFSGHGHEGGEICLQDGSKVPVQEIIACLFPERAPNIGRIPKLFFFDACRGSNSTQSVAVPRSGANVERQRLLRGAVKERGGTDLKTIFVPPQGNTLVAYSTYGNHIAMESKEGGVWMKTLASKLVQSHESIEAVLTEVREDLLKTYQDPQWTPYMQMPETINTLLKKVYLNPFAPLRVPDASPLANASPPGILTQRDSSHPGHYRFRLLQLEQQGIISDVKDEYKDNFICVLTFVHVSTRRKLQFQSEKVVGTKAEAKESAAKVAVLSLDVEAGKPCTLSPGTGGKPKASGTCAAAVASSGKDPITKLKEYCEKNKVTLKYEEVKCDGQQFKFRVMVEGKPYNGTPQSSKKEAKKTAAQKALNGLKL